MAPAGRSVTIADEATLLARLQYGDGDAFALTFAQPVMARMGGAGVAAGRVLVDYDPLAAGG